jgi:hypothetical protein
LPSFVACCLGIVAAVPDRPVVYAREADVAAIHVDPPSLELRGQGARFRLLVTATTSSDITRRASYRTLTPDTCAISPDGVVTALADGDGRIEVAFGGETRTVSVTVRESQTPRQFHFERDIVPILSRYGCNASGCHGKAEGQNGFKLSVFGFDPNADYAALVHESRGRRLSRSQPDDSLLLTKIGGRVPHGGGVRIKSDAVEYAVLRDWIAAGAPFGSPDAPPFVSIELSPRRRQMSAGATQQLRVVATDAQGRRFDVTPLARFQSNHDGLASVDEQGLVTAGMNPGDVAVMAAFLGFVDVFRVLIPQPESTDGLPRPPVRNFIDELVDAKLRQLNVVPSGLCSDAEFLRRASLDVIGALPTAVEARAFLADPAPDKRAKLVDALLDRPEFADYQALQWADLLRVDREKLGRRGAYEFYRWIRDSFRANKPFDQFARELVTAEGLLSQQPAGYFYRVLGQPGERASTLSQVLLGVRIECAQCHHHPSDRWSQRDYTAFQAFFVQPQFKATPRGDLLFASESAPELTHPRTGEVVGASPLAAPASLKSPPGDRRAALAAWLTSPDNPWFAKNLANRVWSRFLGRGLVEPVDDVRLTNPPSNPELLDALARHVVENKFDVKELIRAITASRTYQLSSQTNASNQHDEQNYSRALFRPLPAEVLFDAICQTTGVSEKFDGVPFGPKAVQLWDSQVSHEFLKAFGRPTRTSACQCERVSEPNVAQVLKVMNSPVIQEKLSHADGAVARWARSSLADAELIDDIYLTFFSRFPDEAERNSAAAYLRQHAANRRSALEDLAWSLLNTTEFVFQH